MAGLSRDADAPKILEYAPGVEGVISDIEAVLPDVERLLMLLQLLDDRRPHRLRDNGVHHIDDLVQLAFSSRTSVPRSRPSTTDCGFSAARRLVSTLTYTTTPPRLGTSSTLRWSRRVAP